MTYRERERDKELREKDKELIIAKSPIAYVSRLGKTMPNVILDLQIDSKVIIILKLEIYLCVLDST